MQKTAGQVRKRFGLQAQFVNDKGRCHSPLVALQYAPVL
jgi:hypothetical protein